MSFQRSCSKPSCSQHAVATLTYVYDDGTAVLGPLATLADPHCYDLCAQHAESLTVPRGWEVVRLDFDPAQFSPSVDDLEALADAVREAARPKGDPGRPEVSELPAGAVEIARRGHLRVLRAAE